MAKQTKRRAAVRERVDASRQYPLGDALDLLRELTGVDLSRCPSCQKGTMMVVGELPRISSWPQWDSS